jgi:HAD superfamily hydrolase (TIGR01490 family)
MVFFDVDHTLTRRTTGRRFAEYCFRLGLITRRHLVPVPFFYLGYRLGWVTKGMIRRALRPIVGVHYRELERLGRECFEEVIRHDVFEEAISEIRRLREAGERVVLATTSLDFIVAPLAEYLEVDDVIATQLEYSDGFATGETAGPAVFRREKHRRVFLYLKGLGISLSDCRFYTDSYHDLPLLLAIGRPVPTNPDLILRLRALVLGWETRVFGH